MKAEKFTTFIDLLKDHEDSERTALICGDETLTYRELILDAKQIARALAEEGVKKGDRVLFCMRRTADAIRGVLGIVYAGGVFIAADPDWPEQRLCFIANDAKICFSLTEETFRYLMEKTVSDQTPLPLLSGDDEIGIIFTSGSTGEPKGAVLHHRQYGAEIMGPSGFGSRDLGWERFQLIMKFSYQPSLEDCFKVLAMNKTLLLSSEDELNSIDALGRSMEKHRADAISGTSSMFLRFFETPSFFHAFQNIKYVRFVGEKVTLPVIEKIRQVTDAEIYNCYGCTEMTNCGTYHYRNDGKLYLGEPGIGVQRFVLDENLKEVRPGQTGELFIGGDPARLGYYLNRPELNAEKYIDHPVYGRLFRMGDLVRLEDNGELTALGRADGMVKLRGQRLETSEVEKRVEQFQGVRRAAVKLIGTSPKEALACWYTVSEEISETELRRFLSNQLPYYMVPTVYMQLEQMPENEHGKLQYRDLPEAELPEEDYCAPETKEETLLCEIFQQVLQSEEPVGVNDNFFALGGDSISAMEAAFRLQKKGYSFQLRWLFASPSARQLAQLLVPAEEERKEDTAFCYDLSPAQREAVERNHIDEMIENIYPVTPDIENKLRKKEPWMVYSLYEIPAELLSKERFLSRMKELTEKHSALRSLLLSPEGEKSLQVVLKAHDPDCFVVDLRRLSNGNGLSSGQKAYFRNLVRIQAERRKDPEKSVLFQAGLIRISETVSMLFFYYSHLLLDAASLTRIVRELTEPLEVHRDTGLWNRRMKRLYQTSPDASFEYWKTLLSGCKGVTDLPVKKENGGGILPGSFYVPAGMDLYEETVRFLKDRNLTMAALIHFAFGRALMEVLNTEDVCFYSVTVGRNEEEMELVGMPATLFPVRLKGTDTLTDCQAQLLSSACFTDHWMAYDLSDELLEGECNAILDLQNIYEEYHSGCKKAEMMSLVDSMDQMQELIRLALPSADEKEWEIVVHTAKRLSCFNMFNKNRYDETLLRRILGEMIRQIKRVLSEEL